MFQPNHLRLHHLTNTSLGAKADYQRLHSRLSR
jgi:hypothetical protein